MSTDQLFVPDHINALMFFTRAAAQKSGSPLYNTGKPCAYGHKANRLTANTECVACTNGEPAEVEGLVSHVSGRLLRAEAQKELLAKFDGATCKRCLGTLRYTTTNQCVECLRKAVKRSRAKSRAR